MLHCQSSGWLSCGLLLSNLIGVTELNAVSLLVDLIPISIRADTFVEENNVGLTTNDAVKQKNAPIEHYQESCAHNPQGYHCWMCQSKTASHTDGRQPSSEGISPLVEHQQPSRIWESLWTGWIDAQALFSHSHEGEKLTGWTMPPSNTDRFQRATQACSDNPHNHNHDFHKGEDTLRRKGGVGSGNWRDSSLLDPNHCQTTIDLRKQFESVRYIEIKLSNAKNRLSSYHGLSSK